MQSIITINLGGVNCYLIKNNDKYILVDTGGHLYLDKTFDNRRNALEREMEMNGVNASNLELIILTHGDNDHVCNAKYIMEKFNSKIAMNSEDVFMVEKVDTECYRLNSKYQSIIFSIVFKLMDSKISMLMKKVYSEFETFKPDIILNDGQTLSEFGFDGIVYHCPGHTKGSICILDSAGNLIVGDMIANNKKPSLAVNAMNFDQNKKSAARVLRNNVKKVYPGHGNPFEIGDFKF